MSDDPLAACRGCFWSAELTRSDARIWCAHATYHGWHTDQACRGDGYRKETRPPSSPRRDG
jgi:hypothetical protein